MTDLTPPPMIELELGLIYREWRFDKEGGSNIDLMRRAIAARDEQWRQRLEQVAWTLQSELDAKETTCRAHLWFSDPQNSSWTPLYRIKEQG